MVVVQSPFCLFTFGRQGGFIILNQTTYQYIFPPKIGHVFDSSILFFPFCTSLDTLTPNQFIKDGQSLVSKKNYFALGFFSYGNSSYQYLGIWFVKVTKQTVVWVANKNDPINDSLEFSPSTSSEILSSMTALTVIFGLQMFLSKGQPLVLLSFKIQETWY